LPHRTNLRDQQLLVHLPLLTVLTDVVPQTLDELGKLLDLRSR
jgi:hypothetical protein